ncbi:hypothetical protein QEN58_13860 [Halomonas alkaliantarctica]|uniref:Hydantoinase/oxoprolinase-like protein n=1 Tax=Halomonas alkaliantarctica TaxID=232346 RepID=A0ABY8LLF3_9GAMM|nr:hypothetical protein [Halomonas alkaliantarctica]WGI24409.1 hypothetical protein QEN58_13860 [Halomonas alkaliantarctica]
MPTTRYSATGFTRVSASVLWRGLSRSYFGRGYLEEVNAGNANTSNWLQGGGDIDPGNPVYESLIPDAKVKRDKQAITTEEMYKDYDLYLNTMKGGPGFGAPLDRDPHSREADMESRPMSASDQPFSSYRRFNHPRLTDVPKAAHRQSASPHH